MASIDVQRQQVQQQRQRQATTLTHASRNAAPAAHLCGGGPEDKSSRLYRSEDTHTGRPASVLDSTRLRRLHTDLPASTPVVPYSAAGSRQGWTVAGRWEPCGTCPAVAANVHTA